MDWQQVFATRASRMKASEIRELLKLLEQPDIISFAGGIPDVNLFPKAEVAEAYAEVLASPQGDAALQYSVSEGYKPLRDWIANEMGKIGIICGADNVFITSGSQQLLDYLGKLFLSKDDTALVTWPTYMGALGAFNAYEPNYDKLLPLSNREPSSYHDAAKEKGGAVKFAYCVPEFHNPTGVTMTRPEREWLLDLAEKLDVPVIEDAAYQSLRYAGESVPPILALDLERNGGDIEKTRTFYCGTFSKTLAPGLRIGWVVGNSEVVRKLVLIKQAADLHSSTINQMAIHKVAERLFDEQIAKVRKAYGHRREKMLAALDAFMPAGVEWTRPEGGMFVWVTLPKGMDGAKLLARAIETVRVAFVPGRAFFADGSGENTIRLSFSCASDEMIDEGVKRLGQLIATESAALAA
ncbi:DNA-binding transcriptional MocR family regulator [Rhizobium sp. SG_E_25_P2]|uniref:aminotransferase-like domain-containing protein n=1 Tax=Rhizobium sp. SG_E_25_P2 TaxID=2879942 RepID=UPI002473ECC9|nr:PLP-dependent aminotransferase family protein [Rhizobium sp. SG_E_25_P2]MDH6267808.1 DNA-binding transcriptional MocR family regulator [Rhizobium sp. SG_E_25_P2]